MKRLVQIACFLLLRTSTVCAQTDVADSSRIYTYVEQMPELMSGGGMGAIVAALGRRTIIPRIEFVKEAPVLRAVVSFVVGSNGVVYGEKIEQKSAVDAYDYAVMESVRKLPRMKPGRHNGKAVPVRLTIPVRVCMQ